MTMTINVDNLTWTTLDGDACSVELLCSKIAVYGWIRKRRPYQLWEVVVPTNLKSDKVRYDRDGTTYALFHGDDGRLAAQQALKNFVRSKKYG